MPSRRRSGGLAVDHQDLQMRERLGTTAWHHYLDRTVHVRSGTAQGG
jgi:hypothetical protein